MGSTGDPLDDDRRTFFGKLVGMGAALFGAVASIPLLGAALDPIARATREKRGKLVRVGPLEGLEVGTPRKVTIVGEVRDSWTRSPRRRIGAVWLLRGEGDRVTAFTVTCPHLGCAVAYDERARKFECPCHESAFTLDGARVSGPSPRGMDALETKVEAGFVLVRFAKFRQGTSRKLEVA